MAAPRCPVCDSSEVGLHHDQGHRRLMRCKRCRMVFVDPLPTRDEKHAIEHEAFDSELLPEMGDFFRNCHRDFKEDPVIGAFRDGLRWIGRHRKPGRLLDVGPGTGLFAYLAKRDFHWDARGIDVCEQSATKAAEEFAVEVDVGDFETYGYPSEAFDAVTMLDVLEHTVDPAAFLRRAHALLKPGGVVYVAVPNQQSLLTVLVDRWVRFAGVGKSYFLERLYVRPHTLYFNPQALCLALRRAGFEMVGLTGGNVYLGRYQLSPIMRAGMEVILRGGGLVGMSAKIHALARKAPAAHPA